MKKIIIILIMLIIGYIGWILISPMFFDDIVEENLPEEFINFEMPTQQEIETMTEEEKTEAELKIVEMFADQNTVVTEEMDMQQTNILVSGSFVDADSFHKGSGEVKIISNGDNQILRLENFNVTNGPDLYVILSPEEDPIGSGNLGDYFNVGKLKGNVGNQNYSIDDIDTSLYKSVIIYCLAFSVEFAVATLQ